MRRWMLTVAIATLATPALAAEFSLTKPLIATPSVVIPFSAKDSFGQPIVPAMDSFPGERRDETVQFEIRGNDSGALPGVTVTATKSVFPSPAPFHHP